MTQPDRALYAAEGLQRIPRLLQLLDRDPSSATFGCFDRAWWHLRISDFPCGMSAEGALGLALAASLPIPGSPWHGQQRLIAWARAAISFARRSAHSDGSCDDYYPWERAYGAAVFSLEALALTAEITGCDAADLEFLARRARWVAQHNESGVLANHHAIAATGLLVTAQLCHDAGLQAAAQRKLDEVLALQHDEGWFTEYDGCDPGYTTVTIDHLARFWKRQPSPRLLGALTRACDFLEGVQQPDGQLGGEHGARNTHIVLHHGFELLAAEIPAARRIADRCLAALARGRPAVNDDDRLVFHSVGPMLMAWRDFHERTVRPEALPTGSRFFPGAGMLVWRESDRALIAGLRKGGCFRVHRGDELIANDSGICLRTGPEGVLVSHLRHDAAIEGDADSIRCTTGFAAAKRELLTPAKSVLLRLFMLGPGRWSRILVRRLLQRRVVLTGGASPFTLERSFTREDGRFVVRDRITRAGSAPRVSSLAHSSGQTSHYTAMAQPWSADWLLPWTDQPDACRTLNAEGSVRLERRW